jgi:hypothetical protein
MSPVCGGFAAAISHSSTPPRTNIDMPPWYMYVQNSDPKPRIKEKVKRKMRLKNLQECLSCEKRRGRQKGGYVQDKTRKRE